MKYTLLFIILICSLQAFPQQDLQQLIDKTEKISKERNQRIAKYLESHPKADLDNENRLLWDIMNGRPIYVENYNQEAEIALRTNFLKDGLYGLDLRGTGLSMGLWEVGGIPDTTHVEFKEENSNSRIINKDNESTLTFHATHVAGTLIAKGVLLSAEGMAKEATLNAYGAKDDEDEAIQALTNDEMIISNHSYGVPVENLEGNEWYMGAYSQTAKIWDEIINQFPYYTPVFAAGNDGNQFYEGGFIDGIDKLTGTINSKNTLSVANASDIQIQRRTDIFESAQINSSSSQGPTDDGRIKPDITGLGTSINSTAPDNDYRRATGTSMASPNVAGSALLLQELHRNINSEFMLNSTLRGLIAATADDAGSIGPDPFFGWGVMNTKRASDVIINNDNGDLLKVFELTDGGQKKLRVENNTGNAMRVAISWNDPAGTSVFEVFNDITPVLVNDLDVRVENLSTNEIYYPWLLTIGETEVLTLKGDNIVDNIEIIEVNEQGFFDITISHKDLLKGGSQIYSLIVLNGFEQSLSNVSFDSEEISFWPNPVKETLNITTSEFNFSSETKVTIYDMVGREIMKKENFDSGKNLNIDLSSLSRGVYILNLNDGGRSIQKRIMKE